MTGKTSKSKRNTSKKLSKKSESRCRTVHGHAVKVSHRAPTIANVPAIFVPTQPIASSPPRQVFSIEISSISGDTTIGDLIVSFPRTRDVLMKHGLRFDVEQAGYLYMTLNVFSAIHGLTTGNLVQELHTASKEPPAQPNPQQLKPIATIPTS
jgi:hypothetical protein